MRPARILHVLDGIFDAGLAVRHLLLVHELQRRGGHVAVGLDRGGPLEREGQLRRAGVAERDVARHVVLGDREIDATVLVGDDAVGGERAFQRGHAGLRGHHHQVGDLLRVDAAAERPDLVNDRRDGGPALFGVVGDEALAVGEIEPEAGVRVLDNVRLGAVLVGVVRRADEVAGQLLARLVERAAHGLERQCAGRVILHVRDMLAAPRGHLEGLLDGASGALHDVLHLLGILLRILAGVLRDRIVVRIDIPLV